METPIIIIGGGGHARVLIDALLESGMKPLGYIDPLGPTEPQPHIPWLGDDSKLLGSVTTSSCWSTPRSLLYW